jgi:preprotein translocase subunit SecE
MSFINYLKDTKDEISRISWPTRKQAVTYTVLVVGISVVLALLLAFFDFIFGYALDWFIQ